MTKRGNGLGGTPVEIPRKGRPNTWGIRTPLHFDRAQGKKIRYWIGREYPTKTAAEKALREWHSNYEAGKIAARSDMKLGDWLDKWLSNLRKEGTTVAGYETKIRLHIKPHIGDVKLCEVTDDTLDDLYRLLETAPCPTNRGKPLGAKSVRHVHNILSGALKAAKAKKLIVVNPAEDANPPTERQIRAEERQYPTVDDDETRRFLTAVWQPCENRACDGGLTHHCLRDAALWAVYAATGVRRSEALGMKWSLVRWDEGAIELGWVVIEEGNTYRLRKLTKDGDNNAVIYVDQSVMNVLKWQKQRQDAERKRLGVAWTDHDLVFARDGFKLYRGEAGGPQDPEKVSARWRTLRNRLNLPDGFRVHDWRHSKVTNDLDAGENPVEVSANVRHHSPGYTMAKYGHSRKDGARKLAAAGAGRIGLSSLV